MSFFDALIFLAVLLFLLLLTAFFSGSETSMMSLNRYRLRHLVKKGNKNAVRALELLEKPDRLLSMIITGNTIATIIASSIVTLLTEHYFGTVGVAFSTVLLTLIILFFCEALPKSIAVLKPERFALPVTLILRFFIVVFSPLVWVIHFLIHKILLFFGMQEHPADDHLSSEELHTLIKDSGARIPEVYQKMLLQVLELERLTVADIMVPWKDVVGIDIAREDEEVLQQILNAPYQRLPVYEKDANHVLGYLHIREVLPTIYEDKSWSKEQLRKHLILPYAVPETTPLHKQLTNFRRTKNRSALVVDEYGDVLGIITLEDLLEEIVGEFTTDFTEVHPDITHQQDGSYFINGQITIRELNKYFKWHLPLTKGKTLAGYLTNHLQMIPESQTSVLLNGYPVEILQVVDNRIKMIRLYPSETIHEKNI